MVPDSGIYSGTVVHKRLRPKPHALSYDVFWLYIDLDRVSEIARGLRLFSHDRLNWVALHERDHGSRAATADVGGPAGKQHGLAAHARATFAEAGLATASDRVFLLCHPRIAGYAFNPISVYFGYDAAGRLAGAIYEVNNTFGERHSYVVDLAQAASVGTVQNGPEQGGAAERRVHAHGCEKALYVSPFTEMAGRYSFRLTEPGDDLTLAVLLRDGEGPVLKTRLSAKRLPLTDATLARLLLVRPLVTWKVVAGIHYEALKLWLKGVPLTHKPPGRRYSVSRILPTPFLSPPVSPPAPPSMALSARREAPPLVATRG